MQRRNGLSAMTANGLLLISALALLAIGSRWMNLRDRLTHAEQDAAAAQDLSTRSLLRGFSLPVNKPLHLCNQTGTEVKVVALSAAYWTTDGKVGEFNSAEHDWHQWQLERGQTETMQLENAWDGSAIFYAVEVQKGNGSRTLLTGTPDNSDARGCVTITAD
jgi:hypothetical protein